MPSLANPVQKNTAALLHPGVLLACGLGVASLIAPPARADNQYCTNSSAVCIVNKPPFDSATDTYFWSPNKQPASTTIFKLQNILLPNGITAPVGTVKRLTLRGSSNVTLNASGTAKQEVLIGSLGTNSLQGNGGNDTYVIDNNDTVGLSGTGQEVIFINRCLQVTASDIPGPGGNKIGTANKANANDAVFGAITDQAGNCPTNVASISDQTLRNLALRSYPDHQAPWQRWWPANTAWNRAIGWLQQAITALIQGPHAVAQPMGRPQPTVQEPVSKDLVPSDRRGVVPTYPGVARLIQSHGGNFLRDGGRDIIAVDGSTRTFNGKPLSSISEVSRVYGQLNNKDEIPLNQGIALVYHQQIGLLASYRNDRYPYGTKENPSTVIAQLVLPNGRALPARSIDSVATVNLRPNY
jgi:hypothetical protein